MVNHKITSKGRRDVKAELTFDDGGGILNEEVVSIGDGDPIREIYYCECGEQFEELDDAADHILSNNQ